MVVDPGRAADPVHVLASLERFQARIAEGMGPRLARSGLDLRASQGRILQLVGPGGTRPSDLAEGAWITKQAISKRIQDLEQRGLVRLAADPRDRRAVLVHLTPEGERARELIGTCIDDFERELAASVGDARYAAFRAVLEELGLRR